MAESASRQIEILEARLDNFDPAIRAQALDELLVLAQEGAVRLASVADVANMHVHTFFSFNAFGHSPTALAWLAKRRGFGLMGIVDFDVLDGVDEFLDACQKVGMRGTAGIETRVFVPELATQEINSVGEPGVCYHLGIGFAHGQVPASVAGCLEDLRRRADQRNRHIVSRVNAYLARVTIDYERDVLPLTPLGNPTERHLVAAYVQAAKDRIPHPAAFWADKLKMGADEIAAMLDDEPRMERLIRTGLIKRGGVGYVEPESDMFPSLDAFHELIVASGALPCAAWLDGTTSTERSIEGWLEFLIRKGVAALNIIPDRNWNIADPEMRRLKVQKLYEIVDLSRELDLPLNVGTEMNRLGQRLVDDFDAEELAPVRQAFMDGARFVYGHTVMQRELGIGYQSEWARTHLPSRRARNEFFLKAGALGPPERGGLLRWGPRDPAASPGEILATMGSASSVLA
jgi:hypothetical protein